MKYIVHLKYPLMLLQNNKLERVNKLDCLEKPPIIEQDGERYVGLPKTTFRIDENPFENPIYFVPITYYSNDDIPNVLESEDKKENKI